MNNEPVAWMFEKDGAYMCIKHDNRVNYDGGIPLYTHPVNPYQSMQILEDGQIVPVFKELTDEDIAKVVHELNQKANTPERWVTAMQIGAETIIQLRDELAILRKAQGK